MSVLLPSILMPDNGLFQEALFVYEAATAPTPSDIVSPASQDASISYLREARNISRVDVPLVECSSGPWKTCEMGRYLCQCWLAKLFLQAPKLDTIRIFTRRADIAIAELNVTQLECVVLSSSRAHRTT